MSNQEAIALLRNLEDSLDSYCELSEEGKTAFRMAVEALSSSEFPNSSGTDCISRQQAIDALDQIFDRCEEIEAHLPEGDPDRTGYKMYPDYMTVWKYLHQLPSAQPDIIRCKDWVPGYITDNDDFIPPKCGEWQQMVGHSSDDYCSLAERREVTT